MAVGDRGSRTVGQTEFYGGMSTDRKIGIENSFADAECLDFRKSPSQMTVLPMSRAIPHNNVIQQLPVAMCQIDTGEIFAVGEGGDLYAINDNNEITRKDTSDAPSGFGVAYLGGVEKSLYRTTSKTWFESWGQLMAGITPAKTIYDWMISGIPFTTQTRDYSGDALSPTWGTPNGILRSTGTNSINTSVTPQEYNVLTAISEDHKNKTFFYSEVSPLRAVHLWLLAKPLTGNLVVSVHDSGDRELCTATIPASAIATGEYTTARMWATTTPPITDANIKPSDVVDIIPYMRSQGVGSGEEYHVHVHASVGGFKLKTVTASDMQDMDFMISGYALRPTRNGKHPMKSFGTYDDIYIGNGNYLAAYNAMGRALPHTYLEYLEGGVSVLDPHRIMFDEGYEVCDLTYNDEYVAIALEKNNTSSTRGFQAGQLAFWDMQSDSFNTLIECEMGAPQCIFNYGNILYAIINGAMYAYTGGKELVKVRTLPGTNTEYSGRLDKTDVYPNVMTTRRNILLMGFPSETSVHDLRFGIHSWGSAEKNYPNSFGYNYKIPGVESQVNTEDQTLRIGCVYNFSDTLFYGYEVDGVPGLACVDNSSGASTTFKWESLVFDAGSPKMQKDLLGISIYTSLLRAGETIQLKYRIDNNEWRHATHTLGEGEREMTWEMPALRFHEVQWGFEGTTNNTQETPVIREISIEVRIMNEEKKT